jgi:hypothetical protein
VDVDDYSVLIDKTKIRCTENDVGFQHQTPRSCVNSSADEKSPELPTGQVTVAGSWPDKFEFPISKLPTKVVEALKNGTDLTLPKHRHFRGLLLNTLCDEAVKYKSHPNCGEKNEMAKSIVATWPHLREPVGRGYDGWLSSIVDCLKAKRRTLGIIDKGRSQAVRKRMATSNASSASRSSGIELLTASPRALERETDSGGLSVTGMESPCLGRVNAPRSAVRILEYEESHAIYDNQTLIMKDDVCDNRSSGHEHSTIMPHEEEVGSVPVNTGHTVSSRDVINRDTPSTSSVIDITDSASASKNVQLLPSNVNAVSVVASHTVLDDKTGEFVTDEKIDRMVLCEKANRLKKMLLTKKSHQNAHSDIAVDQCSADYTGDKKRKQSADETTSNRTVITDSTTLCTDIVKPLDEIDQNVALPTKRARRYNKRLENNHPAAADCCAASGSEEAEINEMKVEWQKSLDSLDINKIIDLLRKTYDRRRQVIYAKTPFAIIQSTYPALFSREGIVNEYEMVTGSVNAMKIGRQQFLNKGPKILLLAESMLPEDYDLVPKKLTQKQQLIKEMLKILSLEDGDDVNEVRFSRALTGLMLLPILLGDNANLMYKIYEVYTSFYHCIVFFSLCSALFQYSVHSSILAFSFHTFKPGILVKN